MARATFPVKVTGPGPWSWEVQCVAPEDTSLDLADYIQRRLLRGDMIEVATPRPISVTINSAKMSGTTGWAEIVTPGYHRPQGDSMQCDNPRCPDCYPQNMRGGYAWSPIEINFNNSAAAEAIADAFKISVQDLGLPTKNKERSMPSSVQQVINGLRELDEAEFPHISREIDNIKRQNKDRIVKGLNGVVDLETLKSPDIRSFAIAYYQNGEVRIARGVEFGDTELIGEKDVDKVHRVYVQGRDYPACGAHSTMPVLRKKLEDNNIIFRIAYYV